MQGMILKIASLTVFAIFWSCKHKSRSELQDYSPNKDAYVAEIHSGSVYISYEQVSYLFPEYQSENNGVYVLTESEAPKTQQDYANIISDVLSSQQQPTEEYSQEDQTSGDLYTGADIKSSLITSIKSSISRQLSFSLAGLAGAEIGAALQKNNLVSLAVSKKQTPIGIDGLNEPEKFVKMSYSASFSLQLPKGSVVKPEPWVPIAVHTGVLRAIEQNYRSCIEKSFFESEYPDIYNIFYYFRPNQCQFEQLNKEHKIFQASQMQIKAKNLTVKDGGQPEYDNIWKDGKLVATFVFGKYEEKSSKDPGTDAYKSFVKKLNEISFLKNRTVKIDREGNFRALYDLIDARGKRFKVDVQAVHVSNINKFDYEIGELVFGGRIGEQDLFMYNGHSGYGNNISHIEDIIRPKKNKYVLFYLNGCNTYSYTKLDNDNYDVLTNIQPTYFRDMSESSYVMLDGILRQQSYKTILTRMPQSQDALVSGEDRKCIID